MLGVDTEFTFDRPAVPLPNGSEFIDVSTVRPQVCTVAAWCGATNEDGRMWLLNGLRP